MDTMKPCPAIRISSLFSLMLALLLVMLAVPGCNRLKANPLNFKLLSVNTDQGIELLLITKDKNGNPNKLEGIVTVELWYYMRPDYDVKTDDKLVQEWNDIPLTEETYSADSGGTLFHAYDKPHHFQGVLGLMQVTLETSDGKTLVAERNSLQIATDIDYPQ